MGTQFLCICITPRTDKGEKTCNACFVRLALLKIYFANLIIIMYMCVYMSLCVSVCRHPWRSDEEVRYPGLTGSWVVTRLTWVLGLNQGPLQEEQVLTVGPFSRPCCLLFSTFSQDLGISNLTFGHSLIMFFFLTIYANMCLILLIAFLSQFRSLIFPLLSYII